MAKSFANRYWSAMPSKVHRKRLLHSLGAGLWAVAFGCGPTISGADGSQTTTGEVSGTADGSTADADDQGDAADDESGAPPSVCGDGIQAADEACDDGNTTNADGCSAECLVSGTLLWSLELDAQQMGYSVGIDARNGEVYTAVQVYEGPAPAIIASRVDRQGALLSSYYDFGGFSDVDLARQPIASTSQGQIIAGYITVPAEGRPTDSRRAAAQIDLESGPVWTHETMQRWPKFFGTIWRDDSAFILHAVDVEDGDMLVIDWFGADGTHLGELPLGVTVAEASPLGHGALMSQPYSPSLSVLAVDPNSLAISLHTARLPTPGFVTPPPWYVETVAMVTPGAAPSRAFAHSLEVVVWTDDERIALDAQDHIQPATRRNTVGTVLASFDVGVALVEDSTISVHDTGEVERWRAAAPLYPRYARADGDAGLFVLCDGDIASGEVTLSYFVL